MKSIYFICCFVGLLLQDKLSYSQERYFDSVRHAILSNVQGQEEKVRHLAAWVPISIQVLHDSMEHDLNVLRQLSDSSLLAKGVYLNNYSYWLSERTGNYAKALDKQIEAVKLFKELNEEHYLVESYNHIALFKLWNEIANAKDIKDTSLYEEYLSKSLNISERLGNRNLYINTLNTVGSYFIVSRNDLNKALSYFLDAEQQFDSTVSLITQAGIYGSIAITFADSANESQMLHYIEKFEALPSSKSFLYASTNIYRSAAKYYLKQGRLSQALVFATKSMNCALQFGAPEYKVQSQKRMFEVFKSLGNTDSALWYLEQAQENEAAISRHRFELAYTDMDVQQKEQTILQQKYALVQKNILVYGILALMLFVIGGFVFWMQVRRNKEQIRMIAMQQQKKEEFEKVVRETETEEQTRIAGNLHDSVVQKLVVSKMNLQSLGLMNDPKAAATILNATKDLLQECTTEIRELSHSVMPINFEEEGLGEAVREFISKIYVEGLTIHFHEEGDHRRISRNQSVVLFRGIQECVQNALKHAQCSMMDISLVTDEFHTDISIEDNGRGFQRDVVTSKSIGLQNLQHRIQQMGGHVDIHTEINKGTVIVISLPLII